MLSTDCIKKLTFTCATKEGKLFSSYWKVIQYLSAQFEVHEEHHMQSPE